MITSQNTAEYTATWLTVNDDQDRRLSFVLATARHDAVVRLSTSKREAFIGFSIEGMQRIIEALKQRLPLVMTEEKITGHRNEHTWLRVVPVPNNRIRFQGSDEGYPVQITPLASEIPLLIEALESMVASEPAAVTELRKHVAFLFPQTQAKIDELLKQGRWGQALMYFQQYHKAFHHYAPQPTAYVRKRQETLKHFARNR